MSTRKLFPVACFVIVAALLGANAARAGSLTLDCTVYASSETPSGCTTTASPLAITPGIYSYGDTSLLPASSSGGIISGSTYPGSYPGASFYDAFVFTVSGGEEDAISSTIQLPPSFSIADYEERLYAYTGTAPTIGSVSGALDAWTAPGPGSGTVAVLPETLLPSGTYVLEVRGYVDGTVAGGYQGTFQLETVPLPAALPLLLSGLGALGAALRRRRSDR
jgi:hypothetical protein